MNVIVLKGNQAARDCIYRYEFHFLNNNCVPVFKSSFKFNVLITTYEIMMKEVDRLAAIEWEAMIVDEAHRLKNTESKACQSIAQFSKVHHKVLLTGTPLQNNTTEIFGLFSVVDPVRFSNVEEFLAKFGNLTKSEEVESLQQELQPYMLRRKKEDVEKSLPSKEETVIEVELSTLQRKTYTAILEKNFAALTAPDAAVPALRNVMMELRKCCNHPYLIDSVEQNAMLAMDNPSDVTALNYNFVHDSGKMILLHKMLPKLKRDGHRVLIFSQFVRVLDLLERYMQFIGRYQYERIDGSIRGNERQAAIDRYSIKGSEKFVFLICTKAGGLGINLTAADTVIIFDSDWNPQNDIQAMARAHRIGQLRQVSIYRFITARSYESEMFDRASKKLGLEQAVMTGLNAKQQQDKRLSKKEIEELLKSGAMQVLTSGEEAFKKWEDMDIDQILETKTRKIVENAVPTAVPGAVKLSFSKAIMKENLEVEEEVALDDVNFWEKLMPEASAALHEARARAFADEGPRLRKQVERYGAAADADFEDRKKKDINDWTNKEIFKLTSGLESFGFGRWGKLLHDHSSRTEVELSWAALELIRILAQEQDGVNGQNARDVLKWLLGGFEPIHDHALSDIGASYCIQFSLLFLLFWQHAKVATLLRLFLYPNPAKLSAAKCGTASRTWLFYATLLPRHAPMQGVTLHPQLSKAYHWTHLNGNR
jgi:superfamily II DNA or RNA helicase